MSDRDRTPSPPRAPASAGLRAWRAVLGSAELVSVASPAPAQGRVVVRITHALLTRLELEVQRGLGQPRAPRMLGSSAVGIVAAVDPSDAAAHPELRVGTRVALQPILSCGGCQRCVQGLALHCVHRAILGIDSERGALADMIGLPPSACIPLPGSLGEERAVFAVTLGRAIEAVRRGGVAQRSFVSILGDDALAVLATLVALETNPQARLVALHGATLRVAEQFGIPHRALHETGRRGDQEVVVDAIGTAESLEAATRMVRSRGVVVSAGLAARASVEVDLSHLALDEIEILGSGFGQLAGAIDRLARATIDPSPLVARRVGMAEAGKAIPLLADPSVQSVLVQVSR